MRLVVGLGNPGDKYQDTRHNYGFFVIDELQRRFDLRASELCAADFFAPAKDGENTTDGDRRVHLAKPMTFMNRSGLAVRCLAQRFGYAPEDVLVVYDDISLPLGKQRMRPRGSAGGHRGLESVIENLRTDQIPRLRLGIARAEHDADQEPQVAPVGAEQQRDLVEFVLEPFEQAEKEQVSACVRWAADACDAWLRYGIAHTMNQFNGSLPEGS